MTHLGRFYHLCLTCSKPALMSVFVSFLKPSLHGIFVQQESVMSAERGYVLPDVLVLVSLLGCELEESPTILLTLGWVHSSAGDNSSRSDVDSGAMTTSGPILSPLSSRGCQIGRVGRGGCLVNTSLSPSSPCYYFRIRHGLVNFRAPVTGCLVICQFGPASF